MVLVEHPACRSHLQLLSLIPYDLARFVCIVGVHLVKVVQPIVAPGYTTAKTQEVMVSVAVRVVSDAGGQAAARITYMRRHPWQFAGNQARKLMRLT